MEPAPTFGALSRASMGRKVGEVDILGNNSINKATVKNTQLPSKPVEEKFNILSELLDMDVLYKLRIKFNHSQTDNNDDNALSESEFIEALSVYMDRSDIEHIYKKIDVNNDGFVDWQEFTGYLISTAGDSSWTTNSHSHRLVAQQLQNIDARYTHRDMIEHMCFTTKPYPLLISADRAGQITLWNPSDLTFVANIDHKDKNKVYVQSMLKSMKTAHKAMLSKFGSKVKKDNVMITTLAVMPLSGHLCVGSVDCSVTIYDLATLEVNDRITSLTDIPTALEIFTMESDGRRGEERKSSQFIAIGDSQGYLHIMELGKAMGGTGDVSKKKNMMLMGKSLDSLFSMKAHEKWITKVKYLEDLHQIVTSSLDGLISFMDLTKKTIHRSFALHHCQVKCFSWSSTGKFICSGGSDRNVLIWDPYTLDIIFVLIGQSASVVDVCVQDSSRQLYTVTSDKIIRVWDLVTFELLQTVSDNALYRPENKITAILWSPQLRLLYTAGNRISIWGVERTTEDITTDDEDDLRSVLYNSDFKQVVIVTSSGSVKVYNVEDGSVVCRFTVRPGGADSEEAPSKRNFRKETVTGLKASLVAVARLDKSERRLIIATTDNEIQLWNYNNGQCMKIIRPRVPAAVHQSVSSVNYKMTSIIYENVASSGRRDLRKFLIFGTDLGYNCSLEERASIHEEPSFSLLRTTTSSSSTGSGKHPGGDREKDRDRDRERGVGVLWTEAAGDNRIVVGYADGTVILWDLETTQRVREMKVDSMGAIFSGSNAKGNHEIGSSHGNGNSNSSGNSMMRRLESNNPATNAVHNSLKDSKSDISDNKSEIVLTTAASAISDSTSGVTSSYQMHAKDKETAGLNQVSFGFPMISRPRHPGSRSPETLGGLEERSASMSHKGGVFQSMSSAKSKNSLDDSVDTSNRDKDSAHSLSGLRSFASPPPGPKSSAKHKWREDSALVPPTPDAIAAGSSSGGGGGGGSGGSSLSPQRDSKDKDKDKDRRRVSVRAATSMSILDLNERKRLITGSSIVVECAVIVVAHRMLVGACSDRLIRFWDMDSGRVLCSSSYTGDDFEVDGDTLTQITVGRTDLLIGGFENGSIRVWLITFRALVNIRNSSATYANRSNAVVLNSMGGGGGGGGFSRRPEPILIPPLQLLTEWSAHASALLSVFFVSLPEPGELVVRDTLGEGQRDDLMDGSHFILSSGHDQEIHLWTMTGRMVGTFGPKGWDIEDRSTWRKRKDPNSLALGDLSGMMSSAADKAAEVRKISRRKTRRLKSYGNGGSGSAANVTMQSSLSKALEKSLEVTSAADTQQNEEERAARISVLNAHVQELRNRPLRASATTAHHDQFAELLARHPVVEIVTATSGPAKKISASVRAKKGKHVSANTAVDPMTAIVVGGGGGGGGKYH